MHGVQPGAVLKGKVVYLFQRLRQFYVSNAGYAEKGLLPDDAYALRYDGGGAGLLQHGTASIDHCVASLPAVVHGVVLRYVYVHQSRALPETEPSYMRHCCGYVDGSERVALGKGVVAYGFQAIRQVGNP